MRKRGRELYDRESNSYQGKNLNNQPIKLLRFSL